VPQSQPGFNWELLRFPLSHQCAKLFGGLPMGLWSIRHQLGHQLAYSTDKLRRISRDLMVEIVGHQPTKARPIKFAPCIYSRYHACPSVVPTQVLPHLTVRRRADPNSVEIHSDQR
jgi:hypothetical protein